jgi:hypothetical protein
MVDFADQFLMALNHIVAKTFDLPYIDLNQLTHLWFLTLFNW